jgi:hypothetical protein
MMWKLNVCPSKVKALKRFVHVILGLPVCVIVYQVLINSSTDFIVQQGHSRTRELESQDLLDQLPALQQLLYRLVGCRVITSLTFWLNKSTSPF